MLYIVAGASRSGKTTLARRFFHNHGIPFFSFDFLFDGLLQGCPEVGLKWDDKDKNHAVKMWPIEKGMLESMLRLSEFQPYLVEGSMILPEQLMEMTALHAGKIKACWMGYAHTSLDMQRARIDTYGGGQGDWLSLQPDDFIRQHLANSIEYSRELEQSCCAYSLPYFDVGDDFEVALQAAETYLSGETV